MLKRISIPGGVLFIRDFTILVTSELGGEGEGRIFLKKVLHTLYQDEKERVRASIQGDLKEI